MPGDLGTIRALLKALREDAALLEREHPAAARMRQSAEQLTEAIQEREVEAWEARQVV
jgi:hypothetical protein